MSADVERLPPPNEPTAFESLCLDLWKDIWKDLGAQKNGRSGQPQAGVDIFGQQDGKWFGVQCKQKNGLLRTRVLVKELDTEVEAAKQFMPPLTGFILATSAPADEKVQLRARELTQKHRGEGIFTVEVWSWEKIWHELYGRQDLLKRIQPVYWPTIGFGNSELETLERKRRIDAVVPSTTEVGHDVELFVQVRFPSSSPLGIKDWPLEKLPSPLRQASEEVGLTFPRNPQTGKLESGRLLIAVVTSDFEVQNGLERELEVPPHKLSNLISFLLKPKRKGECRINLEVYAPGKVLLGTVPLEATVGGVPQKAMYRVASLPMIVIVGPLVGPFPPDGKVTVPLQRNPLNPWRWVKRVACTAVVMGGITTMFLCLRLDPASRVIVLRHPPRIVPLGVLEIRNLVGLDSRETTLKAKRALYMALNQQDFAEDPLSMLDTLDRAVFSRTNSTAGVAAKLTFIIPSTNNFILLMNLGQSSQNIKTEWQISENSENPVIETILQDTRELKQVSGFAEQYQGSTIFEALVLSLPSESTVDKFNAYYKKSVKLLSQVQSVRIMGSTNVGSRWLFLCELRASDSEDPVLVLFHSTWKPKLMLCLLNGSFINLDEWQSDFEVVLPPSAWDVEMH